MPVASKKNPRVLKMSDRSRPQIAVKLRHIVTRGLKTAWLESGSPQKNILLLLHGFPDDAHVWNAQISHFQKNFHVIAPFARGALPSDTAIDESRYGPDATTLDHLELLRHIDPTGAKKIFVVGHDMGSLHAWRLAELLGSRLKGLVIINGLHPLQILARLKNPRQLLKSWYAYIFMFPKIPELLLKVFGRPIFKDAFTGNGMPAANDSNIRNAARRAPITVKQYRETAKNFPKILKDHHFRLQAPMLSISSLNDAYLEPTTLEELDPIATHPTVRVIEGHHWLQCEQPERVNRLLEKFFTEVPL